MIVKYEIFLKFSLFMFPIWIILGPASLNFFSILFSFYALLNIKKFKVIIRENAYFFFLFFGFIVFIFPINSIDFENSFIKYISFFRFVLMFFGIIFLLEKNFLNIYDIKKFFLFIIIIISIDVIKEYITGTNIFRYESAYPGRIASFTNDELIIGYIFTFIVLFSIDFMHKNLNRPKFFIYFSLIILISFMIGERSNFIKLLILLIFFSMFFLKLNSNKLKLKFIKYTFYSIFVISVFFIALKDSKQARKIYPFFKNIEINNIDIQNLKDKFDKSKHAPHYLAAIDIFNNYPIFGIGINNFYKESSKEIYFNDNLTFGSSRSSTHPHQIYLEILSETGISGLIYFILIFLYPIFKIIKIRNFSDKKLIFSHLMLHIFFIFPVLPTGSFFGTIYGIPFWLNLACLIYFVNESNKIKS